MNRTLAASFLLAAQVTLVLSVAGKYLYERNTRPRLWVPAAQVDPSQPLRGRYLALQLGVDACGLPHDKAHFTEGFKEFNTGRTGPGTYRWRVSLSAQNGRLVPRLEDDARSPEGIHDLNQPGNRSCDRVPLGDSIEFFIPDTAKPPFPVGKGQELWVEVTVPVSGPPRPIQLALSDVSGFHALRFE